MQGPTKTQVKVYKGRGAMASGVKSMGKKGWVVINTSTHLGGRGARKFLLGFLAKQKEIFTVTFGQY